MGIKWRWCECKILDCLGLRASNLLDRPQNKDEKIKKGPMMMRCAPAWMTTAETKFIFWAKSCRKIFANVKFWWVWRYYYWRSFSAINRIFNDEINCWCFSIRINKASCCVSWIQLNFRVMTCNEPQSRTIEIELLLIFLQFRPIVYHQQQEREGPVHF